jgi:hypothetical protein
MSSRKRISLAILINSVIPMSQNLPLIPSYDSHEALFNAGALPGCAMEDPVTRFVADLLKSKNRNFPDLKPVDPIPLRTTFRS